MKPTLPHPDVTPRATAHTAVDYISIGMMARNGKATDRPVRVD